MKQRAVTNIDKIVSKNLRRIRRSKGFTQKELADALGVSFQQIQKYERASNRIPAGRLYLFSKLLSVSLCSFFTGADL